VLSSSAPQSSAGRSDRLKGYLIVTLAWVVVRLLLLPLVDPVLMHGDDAEYVRGAHQLLAGHGLDGRSPAYSAFLAATLWLGPTGIFAIQSLATLAAAFVTVIYLGFWPALLIAACPFFPMFEWSLLTEPWSVSLLWCGWLLAFWPRRGADPWIGGVLLALTILMRTTFLLLPLVAVAILLSRRARRAALALAVAAYLPVAVILPQAHGNSYFGWNLWIGTWERNGEWKTSLENWPPEATKSPQERDELLKAWHARDDRIFLGKTIERYRTEPLTVLSAWAERYPWQWIGTRSELTNLTLPAHSPAWYACKGALWLLNSVILALGLAGAAMAFYRRDPIAVLAAPIVYLGLIYVPFHNTELRYSLPAVPFLIGLACYLLAALNHRKSDQDRLRQS
jgi:hypothetical protein